MPCPPPPSPRRHYIDRCIILCYYLIESYFFKPVVMHFAILHFCWSVNVVYHF